MLYYLFKLAVSATLIVVISEVAKRHSFLGALVASVPLVSVLAMAWLYVETRDVAKIGAFATGVFWLVLPSLALFAALPPLLKHGAPFWPALALAIAATALAYWLMTLLLAKFGMNI